MQTPTSPTRRLKFNMGTKKSQLISEETYKNLPLKILKEFHCEQIQVQMRDGTDIPMIIKYDRRFYNEESPWVLFTKGIDSSKSDLGWKIEDLAFLSRGVVCAYPLQRGTRYFDDDWLKAGTAERKLTHVMDFIDSAIFLKDKGLTEKIGAFG